ncbi:MAG: regulatory iron-sulfur-containing complex subunit RicT [Spirochaetes bacterium]|nr:regulatory iron-sulfur-containing complex subunit RicT [Spirochaetota bacterium]
MADYFDHENSEDDLMHLEDEGEELQRPAPPVDKSRPQQLPEPLYRIQVEHSHETHYAWSEAEPGAEPDTGHLPERSQVVALTRYGRDLCLLLGVVRNPGYIDPSELIRIERAATAEDLERRASHEEREEHAFSVCQDKIMTHGLPMKLISAHFLLEEPKVLFFFTADSRVDFRELVKDLVSIFKMRIELRQIGVRDEARVTGGCGICGRILCCHGLTDKLVPVSIKMAKDQNLSLNSMKISGPCGRLLCCLAYEYGFYRENRRKMPNEGTRFNYDGAVFRVVEVNVPAERLRLSGDDGRSLELTADKFAFVDGRWTIKP